MMARRKLLILLIATSIAVIGYLNWLPKEVTAQDSQATGVIGIAWSPDGSKIATSGLDGIIRIWSIEPHQVLLTLQGHKGSVYAVAWSPDGSKLASGSYDDMTVRIWDTASGKLLTTLYGEDHIETISWTPDGSKILSATVEEPENLRVWDSTTGKLLAAYHIGTTSKMAWNSDGSKIALAKLAGVAIVDGTTLKLLSMFDVSKMGGVPTLSSVAWSPDGSKIASGSVDGTIRLWDAQTGQVLANFRGNDNSVANKDVSVVNSLIFSLDGTKLLSSSSDGTIRSWNAATGKLVGDIRVQNPSPAYSAAWSPYGGRLALGGRATSMAADEVQIIVPFPSFGALQTITKGCAKAAVQQRLTTRLDAKQLPEFVSEVKKLTKEQIPPACAADLIAVAEALQKQ
jgi:WD40 repeat protein